MTYFMIGGDKREYGPVDAEAIRQWLREGRANGETLLRADGETLWKPLRSFADFANDLPEAAASVPPSLEAPPAAAPQTMGGMVPAEVPVRIGSAFTRACSLLAHKFGVIALGTLIVWIVVSVLTRIPLCGPLVLLFLEGPIYGSYFLFILALVRNQEPSPGDALTMARDSFVALATASFVFNTLTGLGFLCCLLPYIYLFIAWLFAYPLIAEKKVDMWTGMEWSRQVVTRRWFKFLGLFIVSFLPIVLFHWIMFGVMTNEQVRLVTDIISVSGEPRTIEAWIPILQEVEKRFQESMGSLAWMWYARQFVLLLTLPLGFASFAFVYEDIFGRPRQN
jgi:hypothetical protein